MTINDFESMGLVKFDFSLASVCSMKTGGKADCAFFPVSKQQLKSVIMYLRETNIRFVILGNGSNVIFSDNGYKGAVVFTGNIKELYEYADGNISDFSPEIHSERISIYVSAGYSLTSLALKFSKLGYTGLEFAYGIPASVGGSVYMNAGAYGGEMCQIIESVEYIDDNGNFCTLTIDVPEKYFSYRHSYFMDHPDYIITGVVLKLEKANGINPIDEAEKNMQARRSKQPLEYPSCGSAFKRPDGYYAGALIQDAGLKGKNIGGAYVSEKHAGFIVNKGEATTSDVVALIEYVRNEVFKTSGVWLEPEIQVIE